ncbi:zinc finger and SCAN domain-containing protein 26-like isoform X2 [Ambystoma mexicanum]|uniref:zinc finger and SCAN domain-containing protein 26-like isoform X2 n=1 Tax=Ambystoma mexicanum TaxID=8296 RepID=UPI0037E86F64
MEVPTEKTWLPTTVSQQQCPKTNIVWHDTLIQGIHLDMMDAEDDPEAFLLAFECTAKDALLPREKWPVLLAPLLSGEAKVIYQALPCETTENYDELKKVILNRLCVSEERNRKEFRGVTLTAGARPQTVARQLEKLGRKWLKPESRSPEEIVELIIVEQFIQILPEHAQQWLSSHQVWCLDSAVQLLEGLLAAEDTFTEPEDDHPNGHSLPTDEEHISEVMRPSNNCDQRSMEAHTEDKNLIKRSTGNGQETELLSSLPRKNDRRRIKLKGKTKLPARKTLAQVTEYDASSRSSTVAVARQPRLPTLVMLLSSHILLFMDLCLLQVDCMHLPIGHCMQLDWWLKRKL